jgi:hypothetical protein
MLSLVMFPAWGPQPKEKDGIKPVLKPTAPMELGPFITMRLAGLSRAKASSTLRSWACTDMV